jgi:hypothetical protein
MKQLYNAGRDLAIKGEMPNHSICETLSPMFSIYIVLYLPTDSLFTTKDKNVIFPPLLHPFSLPHSVIKITACLCTVLIPTSFLNANSKCHPIINGSVASCFFSLSHTDHSIQYYKYRHHSMLLSIMWWRKGGEGVIGPLTLQQSVTTFTTSKAIF